MDADGVAKLRAGAGEPWVAPYEPAYKLSPALDPSASGAVDVTALLFADGNDDATLGALRSLGATRVKSTSNSRNHLASGSSSPASRARVRSTTMACAARAKC